MSTLQVDFFNWRRSFLVIFLKLFVLTCLCLTVQLNQYIYLFYFACWPDRCQRILIILCSRQDHKVLSLIIPMMRIHPRFVFKSFSSECSNLLACNKRDPSHSVFLSLSLSLYPDDPEDIHINICDSLLIFLLCPISSVMSEQNSIRSIIGWGEKKIDFVVFLCKTWFNMWMESRLSALIQRDF